MVVGSKSIKQENNKENLKTEKDKKIKKTENDKTTKKNNEIIKDKKSINLENNKKYIEHSDNKKDTKQENNRENLKAEKDKKIKKTENDKTTKKNNEIIKDKKSIKKEKIKVDKLEVKENILIEIGNNNEEINNNDYNVFVKKQNFNDVFKEIFLGIFITLILVFLIFYFPTIRLYGNKNISISYNDTYVEPGYDMIFLKKDISKDILIDSNVKNGVVGEYQIKYYVDKLGIRFKKVRNVSIIDNDNPDILIDSNVINVCPNQEVPEFEYKAMDEYDGDITSFVRKTILDDKVILSVSDSSSNETEISIDIDRGDGIAPTIKLNGSSTMFLEYGSKYIEPGYTVSDNCSNDLENEVVVKGNVGREIGTYVLNYEVIDESGNKGETSRKIIVGTKVNDSGSINNGSIYLTFDDGPSYGTTNKILDILKEEGVKATFFVTCNGPDNLIKRMYDEGHTIALHTATHNYSYIYSSIDNYFNDLNKVSDRVKRITGIDSKIIRFPGGSSNTISRNYKKGIMTELSYLLLNSGYRYYDWNVDGMDASTARNSSDVYYNVTANLSMNRANVVLMHDTKNITVGALSDIIDFGKNNGYQFKKIDMNTYMVRHGIRN